MLYGIQLTSLAVLTSVLINYFRNKRMPLLSTRLFTAFLLCTGGTIMLEAAAYAAMGAAYVGRIALASPVYGLCSRVYLAFAQLTVCLLFGYVDIRTRVQQR